MEDIGTIELRKLQITDYQELKNTMVESYPGWENAYWKEQQISKLLEIFPEGQFGLTVNGKIVGCALSLIVKYEMFRDDHSFRDITGNHTFDTHNPKGDVLYGIEVFVSPDYRGLRLGRRLYDARKELCEKLNLRAIVFGGRIPNYYKYSNELTPREYIQKVKLKEIFDPTLTFQLSNDFHVKKVLNNYIHGDKESEEFAVLLQWDNIYFTKPSARFSEYKSIVRLGLIQWQMRVYHSLDELFEQVEYFIDSVTDYKSDFILFPEFFNAPLLVEYNQLTEREAFYKLAEKTEDIRQLFQKLAISYNSNIITGSMPYVQDGKLYNIGYLCRRNGTYESYYKIHVTPYEAKNLAMLGGGMVKTFDTDCGKIGILICYDVEFPELSRILADEGMRILFVPFMTDTQNGYSRVRHCAQSRAIENECYVAIAGSVGNLPKVQNMGIQYAQSVVFTPCDFAFPTNGIKAETTPNTEMILVVDVDLELLMDLHAHGSVNNLKDRRKDLYEVVSKTSV